GGLPPGRAYTPRVETTLAHVRAREVSPVRFLQLAIASVVALYLVVTTGAVGRLTASGLGCDNWPRRGNRPFPAKGGHAVIEFSSRVVALATIAVTLVGWLASRRTVSLPGWVSWAAFVVFLGTAAQIPLGGLTVIFDLNPVLVLMHFLLALAVLGLALVVALEAWALKVGHGPRAHSWWLRWGGLTLALSCLVLVVTGTVVTASGPHSGGEDIRRLGVLQNAVYVHVRATAVFGVGVL